MEALGMAIVGHLTTAVGPPGQATTSLLAGLLPPQVVAEELWDPPTDLCLFPAEEAVVYNAVDKRRREFAAARKCARTALGRLGRPPEPIVPAEGGAPSWPAGIVGSMTHCVGYAAAALARADDIASLGVDAEPNGPLPNGVLDLVSLPGERAQLADLAHENPFLPWDRLLFSAKEAVYKTWFPLMHSWLEFEQAEVDVDPERQTFCARLLVSGPVVDGSRHDRLLGRWAVADGIIVTAVALDRRRSIPGASPVGLAHSPLGQVPNRR